MDDRLKTCIDCNRTLPLTEFYKHPQMGDGHLSRCKACHRLFVKANREAKAGYYRLYDRMRNMRPDRVEARQEYAKTEAGKAGAKRRLNRRRQEHPEKDAARRAISDAIRDGRLARQSCEVCGDPKSQAHHDDYSAPLKVRWLCQTHHTAVHREPNPYRGIEKAVLGPIETGVPLPANLAMQEE